MDFYVWVRFQSESSSAPTGAPEVRVGSLREGEPVPTGWPSAQCIWRSFGVISR